MKSCNFLYFEFNEKLKLLTCNMKMVAACADPLALSEHDGRNDEEFHLHFASF
jgi:hypothetical protein